MSEEYAKVRSLISPRPSPWSLGPAKFLRGDIVDLTTAHAPSVGRSTEEHGGRIGVVGEYFHQISVGCTQGPCYTCYFIRPDGREDWWAFTEESLTLLHREGESVAPPAPQPPLGGLTADQIATITKLRAEAVIEAPPPDKFKPGDIVHNKSNEGTDYNPLEIILGPKDSCGDYPVGYLDEEEDDGDQYDTTESNGEDLTLVLPAGTPLPVPAATPPADQPMTDAELAKLLVP